MATSRKTDSTQKAATLEDVAKLVGVSTRTVSRVVNDEGGYAPATRERVLVAIEELGYRPNLMARGLTRRRSDTIGLITNELSDPFFPELAEGVQRAAARFGRTMFLAASHNDRERQARALSAFLGHGVDGAIVFPAADSHRDLIAIAADGLPIVVVNDPLSAPGIVSVTADIQRGAELAIEHLVGRGRGRIALLIDQRTQSQRPASRRATGYRDALRRAGIAIDESLIVQVDNSVHGGRQGARELLTHSPRPDAIFAYNDVIALGALQALITSGVRVPDDIAIVGFDDIQMCEVVTPRLTSVRIDRDLLGTTSVEALRALAGDDGAGVEASTLPVQLVHRESS